MKHTREGARQVAAYGRQSALESASVLIKKLYRNPEWWILNVALDLLLSTPLRPDAGIPQSAHALNMKTQPILSALIAVVVALFATGATAQMAIDSSFDSGNIGSYTIDDINHEIDLELTTDALAYTYWTNFKVSGVLGQEVTFNITNADLVNFLYNDDPSGEVQMVYSYDGDNWFRLTSHSYSAPTYTFTQTFTEGEVQIAMFFPFSTEEMSALVDTASASPWASKTVLGTSHQGRDIDLLTITNTAIPIGDKKIIYFISRQHAAETSGSFLLEGIIDFLISDDEYAAGFRDNYVWYIVPMINPDGVYLGKPRSNSEGNDPNRDWNPSNTDTVEVVIVRDHIDSVNAAHGIDMLADFHSQMQDDGDWQNFIYSPSGNTFFSKLSDWTAFDEQSTGGSSCSFSSCTSRGYATVELGVFYINFEPTPHLVTWTEDSLKAEGKYAAFAINQYFGDYDGPLLLQDSDFDASNNSAELRGNPTGTGWYESRGDQPNKLTLDTTTSPGNNMAALKYSSPAGETTAYLSQNLGSPQSGTFSISMDLLIEDIEDDEGRDRATLINIGDDSDGNNGPNSTSSERFVFLAFYDPSPDSGNDDLQIRAREYRHDHPTTPQSWNTTSAWTLVKSGLSYDTWYTIGVDVDFSGGTYDVSVDGVLEQAGINKYQDYSSDAVTHLSFSIATGDSYVDNVYEPRCGDGNVDAGNGELCDDGNNLNGDCCSSTCQFEAAGSACDDGAFCSTGETCSGAGVCGGGGAIDCSASDDQCNAGVCNEGTDACEAQPSNEGSACDDGAFCTSGETCTAGACVGGGAIDCSASGDQCNAGVCNEGTDACEAQPSNEGIACDDGAFCTSGETCTAGACGGGGVVTGDDGVGCTDDICDEINDQIVNAVNHGACDNGAFCDGSETCDAVLDCQAGTSPTLSDGVECTDDSCDEALDLVINTTNDGNCDDGNECTADACDDVLGCTHDVIPGCSVPVPVASDNGRVILVMMLALVTFGFVYWRRHPLDT